MTAKILDGKALAAKVRANLAQEVKKITPLLGRPPGLAVILVGDDPASAVYVRNKERAATQIGMYSEVVRLPADTPQGEVEAQVRRLNESEAIDGFLVQLPLPNPIEEAAVTELIRPDKDADGLHTVNLGRLTAGLPAPRPCTPSGVMALLDEAGVALQGKRAVVIGRSTIVGKPIALMLLERHATVTLCHSRTQNLAEEVGRADIVVAAVGRPRVIKGEYIAPGAAVIDVGINRVDGALVGDVDFDGAKERAAHITPVPGGVGPMTIAMLMQNTVRAAARRAGGGAD